MNGVVMRLKRSQRTAGFATGRQGADKLDMSSHEVSAEDVQIFSLRTAGERARKHWWQFDVPNALVPGDWR